MTETTLDSVNVFPSLSSYEANKGNIGENDISLVPASFVPTSGSAGEISMRETVATPTTVGDNSARSMSLASGGTLTVSNGGSEAWITVVALNGGATIILGTSWAWSGSAPTLAKGLVTLAWYGTFGVANFTKFGG